MTYKFKLHLCSTLIYTDSALDWTHRWHIATDISSIGSDLVGWARVGSVGREDRTGEDIDDIIVFSLNSIKAHLNNYCNNWQSIKRSFLPKRFKTT